MEAALPPTSPSGGSVFLQNLFYKSITLHEGVAVAAGGLVMSLVPDRPLFQNLSQGLKPIFFFFFYGKCCQQNWALSCRGQNQQLKDGWELEKREASLLPLWSAVQTCESDGEDANTSCLRTQRKQWVELGENPSATIPGGISYFYFPPKAPRQVVVVQLLRCV